MLASIVRATIGLRWEDDGDMPDILAIIDADIGQAIQVSCAVPNDIDLIRPLPRVPKKKLRGVESLTSPQHVRPGMSYDVLSMTVSQTCNLGEENFLLSAQLRVLNTGRFNYRYLYTHYLD